MTYGSLASVFTSVSVINDIFVELSAQISADEKFPEKARRFK